MKKIILIALMCVFVFGVVGAEGLAIICIDKTPPLAPSNLSVSGEVGSILLEWVAASDEPDCSGIDYYNVSRNGDWIGTVGGDVLRFVDNESLRRGEYVYTVFAVDLVGHNSGPAVMNKVILSGSGGSVYVSSGSGSSSSRCYEDWICGDWDECVDGQEERKCLDMQMCGTINDRPEENRECEEDGFGEELVRLGGNDAEEVGFFSRVTGGVVGVVGSTGGIVVGVFVLIVVVGFVTLRVGKKVR